MEEDEEEGMSQVEIEAKEKGRVTGRWTESSRSTRNVVPGAMKIQTVQ